MKKLAFLILFSVSIVSNSSLAQATTYKFTFLNIPYQGNAWASGINNSGHVVGTYWDITRGSYNGFLYTGASYNTIQVPGYSDTYATGINNNGHIVGYALDDEGASHGFLYDGKSYRTIDYPGRNHTTFLGMNDKGQVVGGFDFVLGDMGTGFLFNVIEETFSVIIYPGDSYFTAHLTGINNKGQIIGEAGDHSTGLPFGFMYDDTDFRRIDYPSLLLNWTFATGINNNSQIVGSYFNHITGEGEGFLYDGINYSIIKPPGAGPSALFGINDNGQILGRCLVGPGLTVDFVATPTPLPGAVWLLGSGLAGLIGTTLRKKSKK